MFPDETAVLRGLLQKMSVKELKALLDVSDDLAKLNAQRYAEWDTQPEKAAVLAFDGPAYRHLRAAEFAPGEAAFCQRHLRILSGLYGLLRPYDVIKPYRLDMGRRLKNPSGPDLYAAWGERVTEALNAELDQHEEGHRFIVNCASQEYFKAVRLSDLRYPVYTMSFPGPAVYAKQARGAAVRYAVTAGVSTPEGLKGFTGNSGEWRYDAARSSEFELVFVRGAGGGAKAAAKPAATKSAAAARGRNAAAAAAKPAAARKAGGKGASEGAGRGTKRAAVAAAAAAEPAKQVDGGTAPKRHSARAR